MVTAPVRYSGASGNVSPLLKPRDLNPAAVRSGWLRLVATYCGRLAPGSVLIISMGTSTGFDPAEVARIEAVYRTSQPVVFRPHEQIAAFFAGTTLLEPGLVPVSQWRPDGAEAHPCAALAAAVPTAADVRVTGPRRCAVDDVEVGFSIAQVETDVPGAAGVRPGGRLESVHEAPGVCTVTRQASDTTLLAPSRPYLYRETLTVSAAECATARELGEVIEVTLPGPTTPQTGALALGSLEDVPAAEDVGAPFDPCATVGWSAFPADLRPDGVDPRPFPSPVDADTPYRVGCDYTSDAIASVLSWGPAGGGYGVDPAARPGSATRFAGRPGLEYRPVRGPALCLSIMQLGNGLAGVVTANRGAPADLCAVNRGVLETLAPLVP